jgi:hypothetical protein
MLFPGVESIYWNGRPQGWQKGERPAIWLDWSPQSVRPGPVLTVWDVPREDRSRIREWITKTVAPDASSWFRGIATQPQTWRDSDQRKTRIGAGPIESPTVPVH